MGESVWEGKDNLTLLEKEDVVLSSSFLRSSVSIKKKKRLLVWLVKMESGLYYSCILPA